MTRVLHSSECPACSGRGRNGKRVWMHLTHWKDGQGNLTRVDALCPRCLWMRITHSNGTVQEGRARKVRYALAS